MLKWYWALVLALIVGVIAYWTGQYIGAAKVVVKLQSKGIDPTAALSS